MAAGVGAAAQIGGDFGADVAVLRVILHIFRLPFHVHQAYAGAVRGQQFERAFVFQRLHVVDDVRPAALQRAAHGGGAAGVETDGNVPAADFFEQRGNALPFFVGGHRCGVGAGGLAADVEDVGAVGQQFFGVLERVFQAARIAAAVGKGIGGEINDAHHARAGEVDAKAGGQPAGRHGNSEEKDSLKTAKGLGGQFSGCLQLRSSPNSKKQPEKAFRLPEGV